MENENQNKQLWFWWIVAIILVVCLTAIAIIGVYSWKQWKERQVQAPQEQAASPTKPQRPDRRYFYAGNPKPLPSFQGQILVLTNIGYVVGYSEKRKDPVWVGYRLFKIANMQVPKRPGHFRIDSRTSARVASTAYQGSGYEIGHMAPNLALGVVYGKEAQLQTFLMSNVLPQTLKLNRGIWKSLELIEMKNYAQNLEEIWVLTGGIFEGTNHLASGVDIPSSCFKIILDEQNGKPRVLAFVIGQDVKGAEGYASFLTSVDEIERRSGLDFLADLPDEIEKQLEAQVARWMW